MSKVLLCFENTIRPSKRETEARRRFSPSWRQTRWRARQTTQRALVILSCSFGSLMVWCFGSSAPPRHTEDRGAPRFHPALCFSARLGAHRYGDGSSEQEKTRGSIVSFTDVCKRQNPLWFLEWFSFLRQPKRVGETTDIFGSLWLTGRFGLICLSVGLVSCTDIWMFCILKGWDYIFVLVWVDVCRTNMGMHKFSGLTDEWAGII